jgi:hypothetical protein
MKKLLLATLAAATLLVSANANVQAASDLETQVLTYAPINAIGVSCDIRQKDFSASSKMLEAVKSDPEALQLLRQVHGNTQAAYVLARNNGQRDAFCVGFFVQNREHVEAGPTLRPLLRKLIPGQN